MAVHSFICEHRGNKLMELEFDKEMDAILRKAREAPDTPVSTAGLHLDADVIAAFAENALPERARMQYTSHFADCGQCRKLLTQSIAAHNSRGETIAAAAVVASPIAALSIPWYKSLLSSRAFATAMGTLVIAFGAMLVYFVVQDRSDSGNATVSQVTDQDRMAAAPMSSNVAGSDNAHAPASLPPDEVDGNIGSAANTAVSTSDNTRAVSGPSPPKEEESETAAKQLLESRSELMTGRAAAEKPATVTRSEDDRAAQPAAADEAKPAETEDKKDDDEARKLRSVSDASRARRDLPPPSAKAGPARSGPVQRQSNQVNTVTGEMAVTRRVGGKTFENKDGAWYDRSYKGQETTNVRRGSDPYKKLDSGLRNIAETLSGVVVVVWKDKAYRIQ